MRKVARANSTLKFYVHSLWPVRRPRRGFNILKSNQKLSTVCGAVGVPRRMLLELVWRFGEQSGNLWQLLDSVFEDQYALGPQIAILRDSEGNCAETTEFAKLSRTCLK